MDILQSFKAEVAKGLGGGLPPASEDPISEPTWTTLSKLKAHVATYSQTLNRLMASMDETNACHNQLAELAQEFFDDDSTPQNHAMRNAIGEYTSIMQAMMVQTPARLRSLLEDEVIQTAEKWHTSLEAISYQKNTVDQLRQAHDHYVAKVQGLELDKAKRGTQGKQETAKQEELLSRNQTKLQNAEEAYEQKRDEVCSDADEQLLSRQTEFLKLGLRVVQFQQTLYKSTAKRGEGLTSVIECFQQTLENGDQQWNQKTFAQHAKEAKKKTSKSRDRQGSLDSVSRSRGNSFAGSDDSVFLRKVGEVEATLASMDQEDFDQALTRLEDLMLDAPRSERSEMRAMLKQLERAYDNRGAAVSAPSTAKVPPEHIATLRKDPSLADEFDRIYGAGTAQAILYGERETSKKKPKPEHVDMLLKDPSLADKFDNFYGPGAAQELLRRTGATAESATPNVPPEHVEKLKANPHLANEFDRIYGEGTASKILYGEADGIKELTCEGYEAPDVPESGDAQPKEEHISMLLGDHSLAPKFDEFYGPGAAQRILASMGAAPQGGMLDGMQGLDVMKNTMMEGTTTQGTKEEAVADAVEMYQGARDAAAASQPVPKPTKEPSEKHIQMLMDNPGFASKFNQVYGEGVAESILNGGGMASSDQDYLTQDTYRGGDVAPPMFPDDSPGVPTSISPLDLSKVGGPSSSAQANVELSDSPRTVKWQKENEARAAMGLKAKPHPGKSK